MADRSTIARPYAKAAFREAKQAGTLAQWATMLEAAAAIAADARVTALFGSPKVTPLQLGQLFIEVAGAGAQAGIDDGGRNFLQMLADNRRLGFLPEIARLFQQYKDEAEGLVDVQVTAATQIDAGEQQKIGAALEKRFGRKVRVHTDVDASLIGGAVVRAGDLVIDGSIKSRLERLAYELTA
jgi:F-type H+-transporting ATPase subunit delta